MAKSPKKKSTKTPQKRRAYLTKRDLVRATRKATRNVSSEAMDLKGYIVTTENGWVVKTNSDGSKERLSRINRKTIGIIALD